MPCLMRYLLPTVHNAVHLIGKDITWFHCVIWPALLLAAGLPLPRVVLAHGFVHGSDGCKMSKSRSAT